MDTARRRSSRQPPGTSPVLSAVLFVLALTASGYALVAGLLAGGAEQVNPTPRGIVALFGVCFALGAGVGAVIVRRAGGHPIGWLFLLAGTLYATGFAAEGYAKLRASEGPAELDTLSAVGSWYYVVSWRAAAVLATLAIAMFPDRRPTGPIARTLTVLIVVDGLAVVGAVAVRSGPVDGGSYQENPFGLAALADRPAIGPALESLSWGLGVAASVLLVWRFARADAVGRRTYRWPALAVAVVLAGQVATVFGGPALQVIPFVTVVVGLPVAMAVAIGHDHLFDIDLVVNRLLLYGLLIAAVLAVYLGVAIVAQVVFIGTDPPSGVVTAAALVVVALLLVPVRDRAQRFADRVAFGRRSTPYHALGAFAQLSARPWSLPDIAPRLAALLADGTGATLTVVYVRVDDELRPVCREPGPPPGVGTIALTEVDTALRRFDLAARVERGGELLGAMAASFPPGRPVRPAERRLIGELAAQAALMFQTLRLTSELAAHAEVLEERSEQLRRSRLRLVRAQDAERSRIGRDLHDGAQQYLVAIIGKAGLARRQLRRDPDLADTTLAALQADTRTALREIRELVHGVFPQLLADRGLVSAVRQLAGRLTPPVEVRVSGIEPGDRFDRSTESAAWFVTCEALTNVAKHAEASRATVDIERHDATLSVSVSDDGIGLGGARPGHGRTGLDDRVAAVGGSLRVTSGPGAGTVVSATFPLSRIGAVGWPPVPGVVAAR